MQKSLFDKEAPVAEHTPYIDFENLPMPSEGFLVTLFITVRNIARSRVGQSTGLREGKLAKKRPEDLPG